jgi:hypothetical protein
MKNVSVAAGDTIYALLGDSPIGHKKAVVLAIDQRPEGTRLICAELGDVVRRGGRAVLKKGREDKARWFPARADRRERRDALLTLDFEEIHFGTGA